MDYFKKLNVLHLNQIVISLLQFANRDALANGLGDILYEPIVTG